MGVEVNTRSTTGSPRRIARPQEMPREPGEEEYSRRAAQHLDVPAWKSSFVTLGRVGERQATVCWRVVGRALT